MRRVIVGISGASGSAVAVEAIRLLEQAQVETHLVVSKWGGVVLQHECGLTVRDLTPRVTAVHSDADMAASISSGTFRCEAMLITPCSARTLGAGRNEGVANRPILDRHPAQIPETVLSGTAPAYAGTFGEAGRWFDPRPA